MLIYPTKFDVRAAVTALKLQGKTVGLVPTMGFLHDGHLQLVRKMAATTDAVIVSIFVNPTQFGANEDLSKYPRDIDRDLRLLRAEGVHAVFTPTPDEMYISGAETVVEVPSLSNILQGKIRPGHFQGVSTVVTKLFNIVQPDAAIFGEKDYQQLAVIRAMTRDLDMPITVLGHATAREPDGLAMSSRNVRLTPKDRTAAAVLSRALDRAEALQNDPLTAEEFRTTTREVMAAQPRADIRSIDIRDAATLAPVWGRLTAPAVILLAVRFGDVLLIDNRVIGPEKDFP